VGRSEFLSAPSAALKLALGEKATMLLASQRVNPESMLRAGYSFQFPDLASALANLFGHSKFPQADEWISEQWVPKKIEEIFPFFSEAKNLEALTPPWLHFEVTSQSTPEIGMDTLIDYRLKIHGVPARWRSHIKDWKPNEGFVDTQVKGPYTLWYHTHLFRPFQGGTLISDHVYFKVPGGLLGKTLLGWKIKQDVQEIFNYRFDRIVELFGAATRPS
jgi:ligand-binding SRPBCC domain-containing protein